MREDSEFSDTFLSNVAAATVPEFIPVKVMGVVAVPLATKLFKDNYNYPLMTIRNAH